MEKIKKYFQFSGTISGTTYFLRNLLLVVLGYCVGFGIGYGMGTDNMGMMMTFVALFVPLMWLQVTTIYKRMSALFPKDKTMFTGGLVSLQLVMNAMGEENILRSVLTLILLIFGCILIFKNSGITNHEG